MGNDQSHSKGLVIDKKALEVTDYWTVYFAEIPNENKTKQLTIFQGESIVDRSLWNTFGPLEKCTKNLMIYRHPCILKYISSWNRGSVHILGTEKCRPLSLALVNQTDIEVCLGLKNILTALIFLNEQAGIRHLNVCSSSIYVTCDGTWKLAGFEFLWKANEITETLLEKTKAFRYSKSIADNEQKTKGNGLEQYAYGVLCEEVLKRIGEENTPHLKEFKTYCSTHLKHSMIEMRPKLSAILLHSYFNHEFVTIHSFLNELPLKNQQEKQIFFTSLIDRLRTFDEGIVASQLGNVLLSRIVLLDSSAQMCVLPFLLKPRLDDIVPNLFSVTIYQKYIIPKIKEIFGVRDTQIRLILLEYFTFYIKLMTKEDLQENVLPQLLVGIKDTNDLLVSTTLRCLADLVSILGASVVIGGNRIRIFADGRPQGPPEVLNHWIEARSITPVLTSAEFSTHSPFPDNVDISGSYTSVDNNSHGNLMPERFSPDGGEDFKTSEIDDETWTDWEEELDEAKHLYNNNIIITENNSNTVQSDDMFIKSQDKQKQKLDDLTTYNKKVIPDIEELDIKNQKFNVRNKEEVDFFKDMEPVIHKTNVLNLDVQEPEIKSNVSSSKDISDLIAKNDKSRFDIKIGIDDNEDGWGDETDNNEWGGDDS